MYVCNNCFEQLSSPKEGIERNVASNQFHMGAKRLTVQKSSEWFLEGTEWGLCRLDKRYKNTYHREAINHNFVVQLKKERWQPQSQQIVLFNLKTINKELGDLEHKETFKSFFKELETLNIIVVIFIHYREITP